MHEIKELLKDKGAEILARQVDISLIQRVSVAELFSLAEQLERAPEEALVLLRHSLAVFREEQRAAEKQMMSNDRKLIFEPPVPAPLPEIPILDRVLLTGGTGLHRTVPGEEFTRANAREDLCSGPGFRRRSGKAKAQGGDGLDRPCGPRLMQAFEARVIPVCGDLGQPKLGSSEADSVWDFLASEMDTVFHNGATVNYLFNYDRMRDANVLGTNEVIRLALEGRPKNLNYVSTTFVFGWAVKKVLYETDFNQDMELLDFGYSQSKWVAEQVVADARSKGLETRIFLPALVSPSITGGGSNFDMRGSPGRVHGESRHRSRRPEPG